jgi:hypothetical protein
VDEIEIADGDGVDETQPAPRSTRRRFMKQMGVTLAAAAGFGAFASRAFATFGQCCENCLQCAGCSSSHCFCLCDCGADGSYCATALACQAGCQMCPC